MQSVDARKATCPYCGHEHADSHQWGDLANEDEGTAKCAGCARVFVWLRQILVTYRCVPTARTEGNVTKLSRD